MVSPFTTGLTEKHLSSPFLTHIYMYITYLHAEIIINNIVPDSGLIKFGGCIM